MKIATLAVVACVWLVLAAFAVVENYSWFPHSWWGRSLFILFAPVGYIALEALGEIPSSAGFSRAVHDLSPALRAILVVVFAVLFLLSWWLISSMVSA